MWKGSDRKLLILFLAAFFIAVFLFALNRISEADTGFLVRTGEYVVAHGTVPLHDIFSYTAEGARWVAHYWLAGVLFYGATVLGGIPGLIILVALMALLTFIFLMRTVSARGKGTFLALLLFPFFFGLTFKLWSARPQIFSYCFTVLLVLLLERALRTGKKQYLSWIPPLILLWANVHAGVVLGLAILFLFALHEFAGEKWRFGPRARTAAAVAAGSLGLAFLNPNGYATLVYSQTIAPVAKALGVSEWFSLIDRLGTWQSYVFLGLMVAVSITLFFMFLKRYREERRLDLFHWGLAAAAVALPLISVRHVMFFSLLTFPLFVDAAYAFAAEKDFPMERTLRGRLLPPLLFILALFLVAGGVNASREFSEGTVDAKLLPVRAADFIEREHLTGPMFDFEGGGYLIWRLWPEQKVFLDGRNEVYVGRPVNDYLSIVEQRPGWRSLVDQKYKINYFVMWYRTPVDLYANNITVSLMREEGFKLVYWDDTSIILVRDVPENAALVQKYGYSVINPFRDPLNIAPKDLPEALREVRRARALSPDSEVLARYAALIDRLAAMHGISGK